MPKVCVAHTVVDPTLKPMTQARREEIPQPFQGEP